MKPPASAAIPADRDEAEIAIGKKRVRLTNLRKVFWPKLGVTKGDLLRYYAAISPWLVGMRMSSVSLTGTTWSG